MESAKRVGRYVLFGEIAAGGMAAVHYGRQFGAAGFARVVAIKRLHPHLAKDADFSTMFLDEARIAARVRHPNVVSTLDVVSLPEGELLLVMDLVLGESLSRLLRRAREQDELVPPEVVAGITCDALHGLHAAHEARSEKGEPLGIIHRDVSPHNMLVGGDGITRIVDFGVAKARGRIHSTRDGEVKGKLSYMAPEQLRGKPVDRRCDVFSAGVVMWEALTCRRLFASDSEGETVTRVLEAPLIPPSQVVPSLPRALDAIVLRALARDPAKRFDTARDMASAIESAIRVGNAREVSTWIHGIAGDVLAQRAKTIAELEKNVDPEKVVTSASIEPQQSQISSVSVSSDAPRARRASRLVLALVGIAAVTVAGAFAYRPLRAKIARQTETAQPALASPSAPPLGTMPAAISATPPVTASATVTGAVVEPVRKPIRTHANATATQTATPTASAAPVASERCPIKTFTDSDGIVRFRRDCSP